MPKRKLTKRTHLVCLMGERYEGRYNEYGGTGKIHVQHQSFCLMWKHKKRSTRPEGWFHAPYGDIKVEVNWSWTERLGYYAPKIEFMSNTYANKIVLKVAEALKEVGHRGSPEDLVEKLGATIVEYAQDNNRGHEELYDDYRPLKVPGECAMMTIARHL